MPPASSPDIGMAMPIPVGRCRSRTASSICSQLSKRRPLKASELPRLPPRFDEVQIRRSSGLKDKLPAWIGQIEEEHIHGSMHGEIVQPGAGRMDGATGP